MALDDAQAEAVSLMLGVANHYVRDAARYLLAYRDDSGYAYLHHAPCTPPDQLVLEDLGPTILINARFGTTAAMSLVQHAADLDLKTLPACALESSSDDERQRVAELVATVARWSGFGTSTATKALHKKRPALIPILDNQAIFGAYLDPRWPGRPSGQESVYGVELVRAALNRIVVDLTRPENQRAWERLARFEPGCSRIELFDMVWWMYFRELEPVQRDVTRVPAAAATQGVNPTVDARMPAAAISPASMAPSGDVTRFQDDDVGYLRWLRENPTGVVVNCERQPHAGNLKLHRATCTFISGTPRKGRSWTGPYVKVCAVNPQDLAVWAEAATGAVPEPCAVCRP
jgi:Family of unknown function (DUF6308)